MQLDQLVLGAEDRTSLDDKTSGLAWLDITIPVAKAPLTLFYSDSLIEGKNSLSLSLALYVYSCTHTHIYYII